MTDERPLDLLVFEELNNRAVAALRRFFEAAGAPWGGTCGEGPASDEGSLLTRASLRVGKARALELALEVESATAAVKNAVEGERRRRESLKVGRA